MSKRSKISKICNYLKKTYNTNILDYVSDKDKEDLKIISNYFKDYKKGRIILMNIISNYFEKNSEKVRYVSGPFSLSLHLHPKFYKIIYIFGEYHGLSEDCEYFKCEEDYIFDTISNKCIKKDSKEGKHIKNVINVAEYIEQLYKNSSVFIDIFVEYVSWDEKSKGYKYKSTYNHSYISDLSDIFIEYIDSVKNKKIQNLGRVHFVDIRRTESGVGNNEFEIFQNMIQNNNSNIKEIEQVLKTDKFFINILNNLNGSIKDVTNYIINVGKNMKVLKKEVNKSYLGKFIIDNVLVNFVSSNEDNIKSLIIIVKKIQEELEENNLKKDSLNRFLRLITILNAWVVDVYTLCRMFKKFNIKDKDQINEPMNIIFYGGEGHCRMIRNFLKTLGFINQDIDINLKKRCIKIQEEFQPLFSNFKGKDKYYYNILN